VENLSTGDRQMVEIARAIREEPRVIIFDEPTSSLTGQEKQRLFGIIRLLKAHGSLIIYITHFTDEVFEICDRITVMRNGQTVSTGLVAESSPAEIVHQMIGNSSLTEAAWHRAREPEPKPVQPNQILVQANGIGRSGVLKNISLRPHVGEIVGLWGLLGSGRTELARSLVGLDPIDTGEIANGLNQVGANPYVYRLVTGAVIFVAMYADALSRGALHKRFFRGRRDTNSLKT
jgi:ABC-type sugar transport system ATPase subunit